MFSTIMQKVNAQRERSNALQDITKENVEEQARVIEQEEALRNEN